jgi:hypothetical protein
LGFLSTDTAVVDSKSEERFSPPSSVPPEQVQRKKRDRKNRLKPVFFFMMAIRSFNKFHLCFILGSIALGSNARKLGILYTPIFAQRRDKSPQVYLPRKLN